MTIERATEVLDRDFNAYDTAKQGGQGDGKISQEDLRTVAENKDGKYSDEQKAAAQLLLDSKAGRNFLDTANGKGCVDGTISREDVTAAKNAIADGSYTHRMLDTAATNGGWLSGPDGKVSSSDIDAALNDPGMPQPVKDAIQLARAGQPDADMGFLKDLTAEKAKAASQLFNSSDYKALSAEEKKLLAQAWREGKGDEAVVRDVQARLADPTFQSASPALRADRLHEVTLLHSEGFKCLPASDQQLVRNTLAARRPGDERLAQALGQLMDSGKFKALTADEKTAVLSQMRNYPDARVADNFSKLLDKSWFSGGFLQSGMSLDDKQRTLKLVAHMTVNSFGDQQIVENTLGKLLNGDVDLKWEDQKPGVGGYYQKSSHIISLSKGDISADNSSVPLGHDWPVVVLAHEMNHAIDKVSPSGTHEYLDKEYQAYYTGHKVDKGNEMNRVDAAGTWKELLDPVGIYGKYSTAALGNKDEAQRICDQIEKITGVSIRVTDQKGSQKSAADLYKEIDVLLSAPESWRPPSSQQPALSANARPQGNTTNQ